MSNPPDINQDYWTGNRRNYIFHTRHGNDTPQSLLKLGVYRENWYSRRSNRHIRDYFDAQFKNFNYYSSFNADQFNGVYFDSVSEPLTAEVVAKIYAKWKGSDFSLGVTVAEGREAVDMIANRFKQLSQAAYYLRKGRFSQFFKTIGRVNRGTKKRVRQQAVGGNLTSAWLEAWYGWAPLIYDIYELTKQVKFEGRNMRFNSHKVNKGSYEPRTYVNLEEDQIIFFRNTHEKYLKVHVANRPDFLERWGLSNPLWVAWQLVRFSFVIDWFIPVSSYLTALHAVNTWEVDGESLTTCRRREIVSFVKQNQRYSSYYYRGSDKPINHYHKFEMDRDVSLDLMVDLLVELPRAFIPKWDLSVKRVADAAALLNQNLHRLR